MVFRNCISKAFTDKLERKTDCSLYFHFGKSRKAPGDLSTDAKEIIAPSQEISYEVLQGKAISCRAFRIMY